MESEEKAPETGNRKVVFFFDIDNCLYPRSKKVHDKMQVLIDQYFVEHLSLSYADAVYLHKRYYMDYGLAIEGLVRHHKVDPLEYNDRVDNALPMEEILEPNPELRQLLLDFDRQKVKLWLFTNAYVQHARRVVRLLGIEDLFEGVTYCDYGAAKFVCKPHSDAFAKAEREAGMQGEEECYFVDDSRLNCTAAQARGWTTVHLVEPEDTAPETPASKYLVRSLQELRDLFPHLFNAAEGTRAKFVSASGISSMT